MRYIKRHSFRNRVYNILYNINFPANQGGECDSPTSRNKAIRFSKGIAKYPEWELEVAIHEALHACLWDISEESIEKCAHKIAKDLLKSKCTKVYLNGQAKPIISKSIEKYISEYFTNIDSIVIKETANDISRFLCRLGYGISNGTK